MRNMQELAYDIIRYYTDPFGEIQQESDGVERSRLYREIGNRVIKRSIGKYPALDETVRIRGGLSPMPDIEDFAPNWKERKIELEKMKKQKNNEWKRIKNKK